MLCYFFQHRFRGYKADLPSLKLDLDLSKLCPVKKARKLLVCELHNARVEVKIAASTDKYCSCTPR